MEALSDDALANQTVLLRARLAKGETLDDILWDLDQALEKAAA